MNYFDVLRDRLLFLNALDKSPGGYLTRNLLRKSSTRQVLLCHFVLYKLNYYILRLQFRLKGYFEPFYFGKFGYHCCFPVKFRVP